MLGIPTTTILSRVTTKFIKDTDVDEYIKEVINHYYREIAAEVGNNLVERTKYASSVENYRAIYLPPDHIEIKNVRFKQGTNWFLLEQVYTPEQWYSLTSYPSYSDIPSKFMVFWDEGRIRIEFDPIPNLNGSNNIEILYSGQFDPLVFPAVYDTGTISLTEEDATVTGSGTTFASSMVNRFIKADDGKHYYEIDSITNGTELELITKFQEPDISASAYEIVELMRIPPEYHMIPAYGAAMEYWMPLDQGNFQKYERMYQMGKQRIENHSQSRSSSSVIPGKPVSGIQGSVPRNYPRSALTQI